jgi:hypothetical protein
MEDYIFLIIAIVLSIFGAINKKKKITEKADPSFIEKPQRTKNFFLDQLLGEDFLENSQELIKPVVQQKPILKRPDLVVNPITVNRSGFYHEGFKSTLPDQKKKPFQNLTTNAQNIEPEMEYVDLDSPDYLGDFSLRKAFVYSEIMHPKYLQE